MEPAARSPQLRLRPALAEDAPLIISILHAAFEEYRGRLDPPAGVFHETAAAIRQKMAEGFFVIALLDDVPAGCVFYQPADAYLYLGRLAVLPERRKHGIARALVVYVEKQATARQLPRVQLGVRLALPYLLEYYSRLGYHTVRYGTHEGYPSPTYAIMEKDFLYTDKEDEHGSKK